MCRITLTGSELKYGTINGHQVPAFKSLGFDDHVKIIVPDSAGEVPELGEQQANGFEWAPGALPAGRDYTVRRYDEQAGTVELDIVRHQYGRVSDWAFGLCAEAQQIYRNSQIAHKKSKAVSKTVVASGIGALSVSLLALTISIIFPHYYPMYVTVNNYSKRLIHKG